MHGVVDGGAQFGEFTRREEILDDEKALVLEGVDLRFGELSFHAHDRNRNVLLPLDDPELFLGILLHLERELRTRPLGYEATATSLLQICLVCCCLQVLEKGLQPLTPAAVHPASSRADAMRRYVADHFAEPHSLADLAAKAGVSRAYPCRAFRSCTGKRLFDYLLERRLQAAMIELRASDRKILSVALVCGFLDLSYFNRTFRKLVGVTPTDHCRNGSPVATKRAS